MSDAQKKAVRNYRDRLARKGLARVEVHVPKADAAFVRDIAEALNDPARVDQIRSVLKPHVSSKPRPSFKEFLASAPLEGLDLTRNKDTGRDIDL